MCAPIADLIESLVDSEKERRACISDHRERIQGISAQLLRKEEGANIEFEKNYIVSDPNDQLERAFANAYNSSKFKYPVTKGQTTVGEGGKAILETKYGAESLEVSLSDDGNDV